jgi:hypothetical protein
MGGAGMPHRNTQFPLATMCPRRETDHSTPPSADVMNEWTYSSNLPYVFIACTATALPSLLQS